jgi:hypothetical protein
MEKGETLFPTKPKILIPMAPNQVGGRGLGDEFWPETLAHVQLWRTGLGHVNGWPSPRREQHFGGAWLGGADIQIRPRQEGGDQSGGECHQRLWPCGDVVRARP